MEIKNCISKEKINEVKNLEELFSLWKEAQRLEENYKKTFPKIKIEGK